MKMITRCRPSAFAFLATLTLFASAARADLTNGGFETGDLTAWDVDNSSPAPSVTNSISHSGSFSALIGSAGGETPGDARISQLTPVLPYNAMLSFWFFPRTTDSITFDWQDAYIEDPDGNVLAVVLHTCSDAQTWTQVTYDLSAYAGQQVRIAFLVHGDNAGDPTSMNVDDVTITSPSIAYIRSEAGGPPWGESTNEAAMDAVFGAGNWADLRYETVNPDLLYSSKYTFIYMEGSDEDADELEAFLGTNNTAIETWVSAGGRLFINAAPNEGDGMTFPFGVTLSFGDFFSDDAMAVDASYPIFNGPFTPVGTSWSGDAFAHAIVSGGGITPLINGSAPGTVLAEKKVGFGIVLFGGMTTTNFHDPQPEATNLRQNILDYTATTPTGALYAADGAGGNPNCQLYILDPTNGAVLRTIGPIGFAVTGLAFDPTTGTLYGSTGNASPTSPHSLITINPATGAGTLVGSYNLTGNTAADITFTSDGTLYGWYEGQDDLVTINKATGQATRVGESGISTFGSGLAANSSDTLYYTGKGPSGDLRSVDKTTGLTTVVASLSGAPITSGTINALAFSFSGTLYGSNGGNESSSSHLITIDTSTGAITDVGATVNNLDAIAFGPAPMTVAGPTISNVPADITAEATGPGGAAVTFSTPTAVDAQNNPLTVNCDHTSGSTFPLGTTTVTCTATDSQNNTATATFHVTVQDTTPPAITVPENYRRKVKKKKGGITVVFTATATDLVDGSVSVNASPPSGSFFTFGTTTVTLTAQDNAGNTTVRTFTVTINKG